MDLACSASPPVLPNLLVQVTGQIEVRRFGSTRFVAVALGAAVQPGDTLRLVEGEAAIFCGNETLCMGQQPAILAC